MNIVKNSIFTLFSAVLIALSFSASAASVTDIKYSSKGNAMLGGEYRIYTVSCSDGSSKKISAWEERKKWCIGTSKRNCSNDQLKTAKRVCM